MIRPEALYQNLRQNQRLDEILFDRLFTFRQNEQRNSVEIIITVDICEVDGKLSHLRPLKPTGLTTTTDPT